MSSSKYKYFTIKWREFKWMVRNNLYFVITFNNQLLLLLILGMEIFKEQKVVSGKVL